MKRVAKSTQIHRFPHLGAFWKKNVMEKVRGILVTDPKVALHLDGSRLSTRPILCQRSLSSVGLFCVTVQKVRLLWTVWVSLYCLSHPVLTQSIQMYSNSLPNYTFCISYKEKLLTRFYMMNLFNHNGKGTPQLTKFSVILP